MYSDWSLCPYSLICATSCGLQGCKICASSLERLLVFPEITSHSEMRYRTRDLHHYFLDRVYRRIQAFLHRYRSRLSEHTIATLVGNISPLRYQPRQTG